MGTALSQAQKKQPTIKSLLDPAALDPALAVALYLAERGYPVCPGHTPVEGAGACTCKKGASCKDIGKHPRITRYATEATTDAKQIRKWAAQWPRTNWGMVTGAPSGVVILDCDPRHGGDVSLIHLCQDESDLPATVRTRSGNAGMHFWFKRRGVRVPNSQSEVGRGLDVRGDGGWVVLPGSLHSNGSRYRWDEGCDPDSVNVAEMPNWLAQRMEQASSGDTERTDENRENRGNLSALSVPGAPADPGHTGHSASDKTAAAHSVLSVLSVHPPTTTPPLSVLSVHAAQIDAAVLKTIPDEPGQRNRQLFALARALKAIPEVGELEDPAPLRQAVMDWHKLALTVITTKDFDETWCDFVYGWPRVKYAAGTGPLADALKRADARELPTALVGRYGADTDRLLKLCRELQDLAGKDPFFISCRTAADALEISTMGAWKRINLLRRDNVIIAVDPHTATRATRYRYVYPPDGKGQA